MKHKKEKEELRSIKMRRVKGLLARRHALWVHLGVRSSTTLLRYSKNTSFINIKKKKR